MKKVMKSSVSSLKSFSDQSYLRAVSFEFFCWQKTPWEWQRGSGREVRDPREVFPCGICSLFSDSK